MWVRVQLQSLKLQISRLLRARNSLTFRQIWSVNSLWNTYVTWQEHTVTHWKLIRCVINEQIWWLCRRWLFVELILVLNQIYLKMNTYYHLISRNLVTGLAWDKFNINTEKLSGGNTIHHTYGICYQNISPCRSESIVYSSLSNSRDINLQTSSITKRKSDRFTKVNKDGVAEVIEPS